jgi:malate dehydrogenase (oxaloacetate-decarboxylating)(NADP+)
MKMAAAIALAELAREPVPESVSRAYDNKKFEFGIKYIIPTPFDPRLLYNVSSAVAKAAMSSGIAKI